MFSRFTHKIIAAWCLQVLVKLGIFQLKCYQHFTSVSDKSCSIPQIWGRACTPLVWLLVFSCRSWRSFLWAGKGQGLTCIWICFRFFRQETRCRDGKSPEPKCSWTVQLYPKRLATQLYRSPVVCVQLTCSWTWAARNVLSSCETGHQTRDAKRTGKGAIRDTQDPVFEHSSCTMTTGGSKGWIVKSLLFLDQSITQRSIPRGKLTSQPWNPRLEQGHTNVHKHSNKHADSVPKHSSCTITTDAQKIQSFLYNWPVLERELPETGSWKRSLEGDQRSITKWWRRQGPLC